MMKTYPIRKQWMILALLTVFALFNQPVLVAQTTPCTAPGQTISPDAGTLTPKIPFNCSGLTNLVIEAAPDGNAIVPTGYQILYVLTSGPNKVIRQAGPNPSFTISGNNTYRIHTLVYDPLTFDVTTIVFHQTTAADVNATLVQGGGTICASLDLVGAVFTVQRPVAGTITAVSSKVCVDGGSALVSATPDGNANVPYPYVLTYVLTSGSGLVIEQLGASPSFSVTTGGLYTIHTLVYNPATLDLSTVVVGVTTGFDINALLIQGGGSICASLDVAGAPVVVEDPFAGALTADDSYCTRNISATPDGNAIVPPGYQTVYVLTSGAGLVIEQVNTTPDFVAPPSGLFTIHTLVYDPNTLDLSTVVFGTTTGFDINALLIQGGGSICGSLDVTGASFNLDVPEAGTLTAVASSNCSGLQLVNLSATANGDSYVPAGYQTLYVLTSGPNYIIRQAGPNPSFNVSGNNSYRIHTLVYDPATLDLSTVVFHQTSALSINALLVQGGGTICASLDLVGAQFTVLRPIAGTITADNSEICFDGTSALITATPDGNANIPYPFVRAYVLTSGAGLVIEQLGATPSFTVTSAGLYTIHTLVYDPATLDVTTIVPGVTTGFDVNALLVQGGGTICASLDVAGAQTVVANPDAGNITADDAVVCLLFGSASMSATPQGNAVVPSGFQTRYLLTTGIAGVVRQISTTPSFTVTANGVYRIQTLVYNPATFSLSSIVLNNTTVFSLFTQFVEGGGSICASVDLIGGVVAVLPFPACTLINPRMTADGDFDAQTYETIKTLSESAGGETISIVNAYPNPASGQIRFDLLSVGAETVVVNVYNLMGQEVISTQINALEGLSTHSIDISNLENGNYMIRIQSGTQSVSKAFMVKN